eukprot:464525-Pelagomonas_calceolata.AAC.3
MLVFPRKAWTLKAAHTARHAPASDQHPPLKIGFAAEGASKELHINGIVRLSLHCFMPMQVAPHTLHTLQGSSREGGQGAVRQADHQGHAVAAVVGQTPAGALPTLFSTDTVSCCYPEVLCKLVATVMGQTPAVALVDAPFCPYYSASRLGLIGQAPVCTLSLQFADNP